MTRLPAEYQEVEYLRGTGTQYIRTSYFATGNTSVKLKFRVNELAGQGIFGSRDTSTPTNAYLMWGAGAGVWRAQYGNQNFTSTIPSDNEWHTWEQRKNVCFLDNKLFYTFNPQTFQNSYEQLLFGIGGSGSALSALYVGKDDIGIVEYWENEQLTMQLIPCYRKSDNVAGYYDTVYGEFLINSGTGSFEVGADVPDKPNLRMMYWQGKGKLPSEYQELSYIESTGTQYILTDFIPTKTTNWEIKLSSKSGSTNWAMGSPTWVGVHYKKAQVGITNSSVTSGQKYAQYNYDDTPITLKLQDNSIYADGNLLGTITRYNGTQPFALFGYRNGNAATLFFTGKIYLVKLYDGEILKNNFIPCFRKADDAVGMYDTVEGKFYTNSGTGTFKKGAYASLPDDYQQLTYIESTGTQWLDTGYAFKSDKARLEIKFMNTADNNGKNICSSSAENAKSFGFYQYQSDALTSYNGTNMTNRTPIPVKDGIIDASLETFGINTTSTSIINGVSFTASQTATLVSNVTFGLFTKHDSNPTYVTSRIAKAKIYLCKLWDNGVQVRDLVPCYRKSDGEVGMFDLVECKFYGNSGTGKFVKGSTTKPDLRFIYAETNKLSNDYQEVDYIQTPTNSKAYLVTDYKQTQNTTLKIVAEGDGWIMGGRTVTPVADGLGILLQSSATYAMFGNQTKMIAQSFDTGIHTIEIGSNGCFVDGVKIADYNVQEFQAQVPMWIFNINDKGLPNNSYFVGKIYSAQIFENGQIVRNYVPSFRKSDNVAGMYETITNTFLTNAGTGSFERGGYTSLPSEYARLAYLDTDNQYFNSLLTYEACTIEQEVKFEPATTRRLIGWSSSNARYWGVDASDRYELGGNVVMSQQLANALDWHNVKFTTDGLASQPTVSLLIDDTFSITRKGTGAATTLQNYDWIGASYTGYAYFKFIKKILPDGTVKSHLLPCVRKSDNQVGWFDMVTEEFLPNNCKIGKYLRTLRLIYM